ncbi:hypothetical protein QBC40DRAFT_344341 [Triangularia verruculosa]|uniref:Uncharacterized protein n=1 Tax=Triangularia verruculosa TaxID=2587418 RepID=A0AAN6X5P1_9PEZI|nr:hypothetical protein QBC40DRAFT_344341 [Triangularia verruculosa]
MCQIEHKVYTVCTHVDEHAVPCTSTSRTRVRCVDPEVIIGARFGFCRACREHYAPLATACPWLILKYWSYKAERGVNHASPASVFTHLVMISRLSLKFYHALRERRETSISNAFSSSDMLLWSGRDEGFEIPHSFMRRLWLGCVVPGRILLQNLLLTLSERRVGNN